MAATLRELKVQLWLGFLIFLKDKPLIRFTSSMRLIFQGAYQNLFQVGLNFLKDADLP